MYHPPRVLASREGHVRRGAEAVRTAAEVGVELIHGQCIMMYARPTGVHAFHAWLWRVLGLGPKSHLHRA